MDEEHLIDGIESIDVQFSNAEYLALAVVS